MASSDDININVNVNTNDAEKRLQSLTKSTNNFVAGSTAGWKALADAQTQYIKTTNQLKFDAMINASKPASAESWAKSFKASSSIFKLPEAPLNDWQKASANGTSFLNTWAISSSTAKKATDELNKSTNELNISTKNGAAANAQYAAGLPTLRYALYDVANVTGGVSKAILGMVESVTMASAKFETAFTEIERTTMANTRRLELLSYQFRELATDIPLAFADITRIGALGAQMNIANSDLAGFTETVAQFSATTNVSIDSAAQSFGALSNLLDVPADKFKNLGSAIAYVGINSVATESEVLSVATAIAGVGAQAGVSKEYMIGISGALASLRVPAEQSRGALTRIFQEVNRAAADGGTAIENFGNVVGMSGADVQSMLSQSGGMEQFFQKFISGLNGLDAQQLTNTLDGLSLSDIRVTNVLARLSSNMDVVNASVADSNYGFANATILAQLYGKKVEDLQSRMMILNNSAQELAATFGDSMNDAIGGVITWLSDILNGITDALSTDAGKMFSGFIIVMGAVVGVLTAVVTGLITATAAAAALKTAMSILNLELATTGIKGFVASLFQMKLGFTGVTGSITAASAAAGVFRLALMAIPLIALIGGIALLAGAFDQAGNSADIALKNMIGSTSGLKTALEEDAAAYEKLKAAGATQDELAEKFTVIDLAAEAAKAKTEGYSSAVEAMGGALDITLPKLEGVNQGFEDNTRIIGDNTKAWVRNSLLASENFQKMFEDPGFAEYIDGLSKVGFTIENLVEIQAKGGDVERNMMEYIYGLQQKAKDAKIEIPMAVSEFNGSYSWNEAGFFDKFLTDTGYIEKTRELTKVVGSLSGAYYLAETGLDGATDPNGVDNLNNELDKTAAKVYLLTDYANDLSSIWKRAFDIRFSGQEAMDKIISSWADMREEVRKTREEIDSLNADMSDLTSDKSLKMYFLSVAEAMGDTVRAAQLRAEIAGIDNDIAKKTNDLTKAQSKNNKTLVGNSEAAIDNRNTIRGMVTSYQQYIQNLAASGASQSTLNSAIAQSEKDFIAQATALGYSSTELQTYAASFDDMGRAVAEVPRDLTVDFDGDAALTAIREWRAKAQAALGSGLTVKANADTDSSKRAGKIQGLLAAKTYQEQYMLAILGPNPTKARRDALTPGYDALIANINNELKKYGYASGGYTGAGGKYETAGIVHRGEYVVPREQVDQTTGLPYFMSQPRNFVQSRFTGQSSVSMVTLSPEDRALLRNAGGSGEVVLYANNEAIARSSNAGNKSIVAAGGRP